MWRQTLLWFWDKISRLLWNSIIFPSSRKVMCAPVWKTSLCSYIRWSLFCTTCILFSFWLTLKINHWYLLLQDNVIDSDREKYNHMKSLDVWREFECGDWRWGDTVVWTIQDCVMTQSESPHQVRHPWGTLKPQDTRDIPKHGYHGNRGKHRSHGNQGVWNTLWLLLLNVIILVSIWPVQGQGKQIIVTSLIIIYYYVIASYQLFAFYWSTHDFISKIGYWKNS